MASRHPPLERALGALVEAKEAASGNARPGIEAELQFRIRELDILGKIDSRIRRKKRLPDVLSFVVKAIRGALEAESATLLLRQGHELRPVAWSPRRRTQEPLAVSGTAPGRALRNGFAVFNHEDDKLASRKHLESLAAANHCFHVAVPEPRSFKAPRHSKDPLGVLSVHRAELGSVSARAAIEFLQTVAGQVTIALEHARLVDESSFFQQVDTLLFQSDELRPALNLILHAARNAGLGLEVDGAQVLFRVQHDQLVVVESLQFEPSSGSDYIEQETQLPVAVTIADSISGQAVITGLPVAIHDVRIEPRYKGLLGPTMRSELAVPVTTSDGQVLGVLNFESTRPYAFDGYWGSLLTRFAHQMTLPLAIAKLKADVRRATEMRSARLHVDALGEHVAHVLHRINNKAGLIRLDLEDIHDTQEEVLEMHPPLLQSINSIGESNAELLTLPALLRNAIERGELGVVAPNDLVEDRLSRLALPANVVLNRNLGADLPRVRCKALDLIVDNLLQNALDAMPSGGSLWVSTIAENVSAASSQFVRLTIRDSGTGVTREHLPEVFNPLFTTKPERKAQPFQFGLYWIRLHVLDAGGMLTFNSLEGEGTTVTIALPTVAPDEGGT